MSYARWFDGQSPSIRNFLHNYGLGLLFAANVFGAGSVYILSETGVAYGFSLLWVLPVSLFVGLAVHEMSARLAVLDEPLMEYIRDVVGAFPAKLFAIGIAFIMQFWSVANYALTGAVLVYLTPLDNLLIGILISGVAGLILVEFRLYQRIEAFIAALVLAIFGSYVLIFFGLDVPSGPVVQGFVPSISTETGYLSLIIALLGTTIYYPNFFIQSSIQDQKNWNDIAQYRRDHTVGLTAVILLSVAVMIVAAISVPAGEPTVADPAAPLMELLGPWAFVLFLIGAGAASFSSATATLFGAGFMIPQAFGRDTSFGDRSFRVVVEALIALSVVIAMTALTLTDFTPVELAILMPAVNGVIGLPLTVLALYGAMRRYFDLSWAEHCLFVAVVLFMFVAAAISSESLFELIEAWS